jgi:UDP-glucose 4-epimerase
VVVIDNLNNSHLEVLHRVRTLASQYHTKASLPSTLHPPLYFHSCDIQDRTELGRVFDVYARESIMMSDGTQKAMSRIVAAIHFAALKSVTGIVFSSFV